MLESIGDFPVKDAVAPGSPECPQAEPGATRSVTGRCPSNTYLQSSQVLRKVYPDFLVGGGLDWFEWSASVNWRTNRFQSFIDILETTKKKCQDERIPEDWVELENVGPVRVARTGVNRGGGRGQQFEYRLSLDGITIGLANQLQGTKHRPNVFVQQKGRECLLLGALEAYNRVQDVIYKLGGIIVEEKLSRVDPCIDIAGLDVTKMRQAIEQRQFISRARKVMPQLNVANGKWTGFYAGSNPLYMVVYDKVEEQINKADALYLRALIDQRWGGVFPKYATRIEYQISRPWLVRNGIETPGRFAKLCGSLIGKLTKEWFRLTKESIESDQKHQSRAETSVIWTAIQEAFQEVYGKPTEPLLPIRRDQVDPCRLIAQGFGCLTSAVLQTGRAVMNFDDLVAEQINLIYRMLPLGMVRDDYMRKYHCRKSEFQTK